MHRHFPSCLRIFVVSAVFAVFVVSVVGGTDVRAQQAGDLATVLAQLATRTQEYYDRFISIICTETVQQQDLKFSLAPLGKPRMTVYELSVVRDSEGTGESAFRVERAVQSVNGRPPRRNHKPECTDPKTGTPEPMAFLLAANQPRYRFTMATRGFSVTPGPVGARAVDFIETPPERVRIKWEGECFEAEGGGHNGRVWYDPATYDVLQVDVRLSKPFQVPIPSGMFGLRPAIRVERSEMTLRFARVSFQQPAETVLLPQSIDTLHVLRGIPSVQIRQSFSSYRRFLTKSEIRPASH
jgi:hypothetical protein